MNNLNQLKFQQTTLFGGELESKADFSNNGHLPVVGESAFKATAFAAYTDQGGVSHDGWVYRTCVAKEDSLGDWTEYQEDTYAEGKYRLQTEYKYRDQLNVVVRPGTIAMEALVVPTVLDAENGNDVGEDGILVHKQDSTLLYVADVARWNSFTVTGGVDNTVNLVSDSSNGKFELDQAHVGYDVTVRVVTKYNAVLTRVFSTQLEVVVVRDATNVANVVYVGETVQADPSDGAVTPMFIMRLANSDGTQFTDSDGNPVTVSNVTEQFIDNSKDGLSFRLAYDSKDYDNQSGVSESYTVERACEVIDISGSRKVVARIPDFNVDPNAPEFKLQYRIKSSSADGTSESWGDWVDGTEFDIVHSSEHPKTLAYMGRVVDNGIDTFSLPSLEYTL